MTLSRERPFEERLRLTDDRLRAALLRISELQKNQASEALYFNLERAAWALIESASTWVVELRLGMIGLGRRETEVFDLLQREGRLELDTARRFKQLCEFRNLSAREADKIDADYLAGSLENELALFSDWLNLSAEWSHPT
jgi:uncharacterized protein YutE (UPF0331/DUF86 family)